MADAGDQPALVDAASSEALSYDRLADRVLSRAESLRHSEGTIVLFGVTNSIDSVVDYLALTGVGATVLLADPSAPTKVIEGWCAAYEPDSVVGFDLWPNRWGSMSGVRRPESVLLPTSGSTGSPKFVRLSLGNLRANAEQISNALRISSKDRVLAHLPLHYSFGLSVLNSHLVAGATVVLSRSSAIRPEFWDEVAKNAVTSLPGVPYSYEIFKRVGLFRRELPSLSDLTQAGGRLPLDRVLEFHNAMAARGGRLWLMYGQTEATARISVLPPEELPRHAGSVGRSLPGARVWVHEPTFNGTGELHIEGPQVMLGYAERRSDIDGVDRLGGVLETGDVGSIDSEGWITITGRLKRITKIYGTRINLDDVERRLAKFGILVVIDAGEGILVVVEADDPPRDLSRRMERMLSLPVRSIRVESISALPRTASGKVDYQVLRELFL